MHQSAVRVAQDLHLDVPRAAHQLLEVDLVVAEGRLRLAARHRQQLRQLRVALDHAHAAPAAAPARLEHHRVADPVRQVPAFLQVGRQAAGSPA